MNDPMARIKQSPLFLKMKTFTPEMFHAWHGYVQDIYAKVSPEEQDRERLVTDVLEAFARGLESVQTQEHSEKRSIPGWSYGYVCGFVEGNLETTWYNRYVLPHEQECQHLLLLKSLLLLFDADPTTRVKLWQIHQYLTQGAIWEEYGIYLNPSEQEVHNVIRLADGNSDNQQAAADLWQQTRQHLKHELKRISTRLLARQDQRGGVPDLTYYVSQEDIEALLEENSKLQYYELRR